MITKERALGVLQGFYTCLQKRDGEECNACENCYDCEYYYESESLDDAVLSAIESVKNDIPKKPIKSELFNAWNCPGCAKMINSVERYSAKYCSNCGTPFDWSDNESS